MEPMEPVLEVFATRRLRLRPIVAADAEAIFDGWAQDPLVTRFLLWKPHRRIEETRAFLDHCAEGWASGEIRSWGLEREGALIGMLAGRFAAPEIDVGYVLARPWWGQGLVAEALRGMVDAVAGLPGFTRVGAFCHAGHPASARVLEKAGFVEGPRLPAHCVFPNLGEEPVECRSFQRPIPPMAER